MAYVEISLRLTRERADAVSDALVELGALSASLEDAAADTEAEVPWFDEPTASTTNTPAHAAAFLHEGWRSCQVHALFQDADSADRALVALLSEGVLADLEGCTRRDVPEQDWLRASQSQFGPIAVHPRLHIVPSWHEPAPGFEGVTLRLDPGLAFGTGSHPTTAMCLRWLMQHALQVNGRLVLDYGCGSGVLAIAAARLGAARVVAVDVDVNAIDATLYNAEVNQVQVQALHAEALLTPTSDGLPPPSQTPATSCGTAPPTPGSKASGKQGWHGRHDVVLANILATPLMQLAPVLARHGTPGGHVILSGILARQLETLQTTYAPYTKLEVFESHEGWVCLHGVWRGSTSAR